MLCFCLYATVSAEIQAIAAKSLRPGHVYIDCVPKEDSATNSQARLLQ
jgi:hypothetical protein